MGRGHLECEGTRLLAVCDTAKIHLDQANEQPANPLLVRPQLIKLPFAYWDAMENTPVIFDGRPLLVLDYRDDSKGWHDQYAPSMYLYIVDLRTGQRIAEFGKGHSAHKAFVDGKRLYVFATEATNYEWFQNMYCFWTDDLKTWHRELTIKRKDSVPKGVLSAPLNGSVCRDDAGFLMAYVYYEGFPWFEFARSKDLIHWEKVPDLAFAGQSGNEYSNTPAIRYFAPYYYVIYYTTVDEAGCPDPGSDMVRFASVVARSNDLVMWQLSPMNPILQPGPGEGISTSDVEPMELEGNTYLFYAASTQTARPPGWSAVRIAMYLGPMKQFFESWFPQGAKMEEVTTQRAKFAK
ncbi:MAG: hypothetical protein V1800_11575 [Candidatus Latescibacterota bacterium]